MHPLVAHDELLGDLCFIREDPSDPFGEDDLDLAAELSDRAAMYEVKRGGGSGCLRADEAPLGP